MAVISYALGRFGDRRLEKGGPGYIGRWWRGRAHVSVDLAGTGRARCSFAGSFTIGR
jgi:hypothetical protein